ncbi:hypothetical protein Tco_0098555 [Tanacetum coccineum]
MASESTSSQQSQQLIPSSKVNFRYTDSIIDFNNVVALLEHTNELYQPMLSFLSNCCINKALTLQPIAMYVEYLKEFWYIAEVEKETKTITFLLSWWDKPLSFTQDEFISAIGLPICKDDVPLPPKETVRTGLATLGLFDKDKPTLSSTVLVNSSPLKMKYFTPIWKLFMQYIVNCLDLVHKLQNGKKNRELNIFYTRFLSLIFEKLLGRNYVSNDLTLVKPHTITSASFQKPLASEVPLTSHMLKVAKHSEEPEQSLIPPSGEVNADDTADKSLSRASVQPITQSKAPTDLKIKKKRIPPSSKPKSPYKVKVILPKKQVAETRYAEVTVATPDTTKSLVASDLEEEQGNQPSAVEAEKVLDQNVKEEVKDNGFVVMKEVTFKQIMDEVDSKTQGAQENAESPFDTESKIKIIKSYQAAIISNSLFIHQSSSYDQDQNVIDITPKDAEEGEASESLSGLRSMPNDDLASLPGFEIQDSNDHDSQEGTAKTFHASADKPAQSDPLGHLQEELNLLNNKIDQVESSISKKVAEDIQSSIPTIDSIKTSVSESIIEELPQVDAQVQKKLQAQLPDILLKPMYKEFNAFNKLESHRFVLLQKELSKSLHTKMRKSIRLKVRKGMKEVPDKLSFCTSTMATNSQHVQDLRVMFKDMGEQPSAQVVPNEEKALVVHNPEEKKSEGIVSMEDDSDDDGLDKQPLLKRFKIITPIPNPIPLNTFVPDHLLKPEEQQKSLHEFTDQLF